MCNVSVDLTACKKLAVGADPRNFSFIQNDDLICVHNGADPLCHDQHRRVCGFCLQRPPQLGVRFEIQRRKAVVKHIDRAFLVQRAGDGKPLLLSARYVAAALGDLALISVRL